MTQARDPRNEGSPAGPDEDSGESGGGAAMPFGHDCPGERSEGSDRPAGSPAALPRIDYIITEDGCVPTDELRRPGRAEPEPEVISLKTEPRQVSLPAIAILCILALVFFPVWRQTFPHVGLWPAVAVLGLSAYLLTRPLFPWDGKIARWGIAASIAAFVVFALTALSRGLTAPIPNYRFEIDGGAEPLMTKLLGFLVLFVSVAFHESAHGLAAYFSGDATAKDRGRISLNPFRHIELFGTIILPAILAIANFGFIFGWAKPVPVNPWNFRSPRWGRLAVSLSGVAANLGLALLCTSLLAMIGVLLHVSYPWLTAKGFMNILAPVTLIGVPWSAFWEMVLTALKTGIFINLVLFNLNIIPVPPLDGWGVLEGLAPERLRTRMEQARGWGSLVFFALIIFKAVQYLLLPGFLMAELLCSAAGMIARLP